MNNLNTVVLFQIDRTSKIAKQYSQKVFDHLELGITVDQWVLLKIIDEHEPLSQKELAIKSTRDPASITRTLDILEKKGLSQRMPILGNRRQYNVQLSKTGKAFVEENMDTIVLLRNKSLEGFTDEERKLLVDFLLRMQQNMG